MHSRYRGTSSALLSICSANDGGFTWSNTTPQRPLGHWKSHRLDGRVHCRFAEFCRLGLGGFVELRDASAPLEYLRDIANHEQRASLIHCSPRPGETTR